MKIEAILAGLLLLALAIAALAWPHTLWRLSNFLWVKGGEPTEFAIVSIRLGGIGWLFAAVCCFAAAYS